jgi:hypothetical protein
MGRPFHKVKVKCTLVQVLRLYTGHTAHSGSRGIALLFHDHDTRRGWASRSGRSSPPEKTRYSLYMRLGGSQSRYGQMRKISPPPGFDPRTVQPVAQSLYQLSYPTHSTCPPLFLTLVAILRIWRPSSLSEIYCTSHAIVTNDSF